VSIYVRLRTFWTPLVFLYNFRIKCFTIQFQFVKTSLWYKWLSKLLNKNTSLTCVSFTLNAKLQRISLHEFIIMKDNCLVQVTQTDAVSVIQVVIESVVEQNQLGVSMPILTDKNCWHKYSDTKTHTVTQRHTLRQSYSINGQSTVGCLNQGLSIHVIHGPLYPNSIISICCGFVVQLVDSLRICCTTNPQRIHKLYSKSTTCCATCCLLYNLFWICCRIAICCGFAVQFVLQQIHHKSK